MKNFVKILEMFIQARSEQELLMVQNELPQHIQEKRSFFEEMFAHAEQHQFYILTSLFIDWIDEIEEDQRSDVEILDSLEDLKDLFEYVDDDISESEQQEVVGKVKDFLKTVKG